MKIKCFITGKMINDTPEEKVRQSYARKLHEEYGYPMEFMQPEFPIQRGSKKTGEAADIVIFNSKEKKQNNIFIIVETKSPDVKYPDDQALSYATATTAVWAVWTNGDNPLHYKTNFGTKEVNKFVEIWDIPHYEQRLGALKKVSLIKPQNLVSIFQKLHDYIYANSNIKKPDRITTNIINLMFCKIYDELSLEKYCKFYVRLNAKEEPDVKLTQKEIKALFEDVKKKYKDIFYESDSIEFDRQTIIEIVSRLQKYSFLNSAVDSIGTAFEVFTNESLKEDNGQFFTPRQVIKFMVDIIKPMPEEYIIDPACGSGGFLIESLHSISRQIDNSLASRLPSDALLTYKKDIYSNYFFGIDQERDLVKITKAYMAIVGDGSGGIFSDNSLAKPSDWENVNREDLKLANFDVLLTNPPFGKDIKVKGDLLTQFTLAKKNLGSLKYKEAVRPSVLFIERCFQFIKKGKKMGRVAIVLPVGDLSNDEDENIKEWLLSNTKILAIIQLPSETFQPYTGTQTCLLFFTPRKDNNYYKVFMAQAQKVGKDKRGKEIFKRNPDGSLIKDTDDNGILDDDLIDIYQDYEKYLSGNYKFTNNSFVIDSKILDESLLPNYHNPSNAVLISRSKRKSINYEPLENLCTKIYTPPRTKRIYVDQNYGVPFLSGTHITQLIPQNLKFISKTETKNINQYIVNEGDIVITRVGTMGIIRLIGKDLAGYAVSDNINILKVNKDEIDSEYLFTILFSKIGKQSVKKISKGSVQHYNTPKALKKMLVPILPDPDYTDIVNKIKNAEDERCKAISKILDSENIVDSYLK